MNACEKDLWDICDFLAGSVEENVAAAESFVIAANRLADTGVAAWKESQEFAAAVATIQNVKGQP